MVQYFVRNILFAFFLILVYGAVAQPSEVILRENFRNNNHNWDEYNTSFRLAKVWKDNYLLITRKRKIGLFTDIEVPLDQNNNFSISTTLRKVEGHHGDGYGLCWGKKDKDNCFTFTLSGKGMYEIGKWEHGNWQYVARHECLYINKWDATNKLEIKKIDDRILFLINDSIVERQPFEKFFDNRFGFVIYNRMSVEVSELIIRGTSTKPASSEISNMRKNPFQKEFANLEIRNIRFEASNNSQQLTNPGRGNIIFSLYNPNNKESHGVKVWPACLSKTQRISIPLEYVVGSIAGNSSVEVSIPVTPQDNFKASSQDIRIQVVDRFGAISRPGNINIELNEIQPARITISKYHINDQNQDIEGSFTYGNGNGIPEPGEAIRAGVTIINTGTILHNMKAKIFESKYDPNLALVENGKEYFLGDIKQGESKTITFDFFSSKAYKKNEIPINIRFWESGGGYFDEQLMSLSMREKPPEQVIPITQSTKNQEMEFEENDIIVESNQYKPGSYVLIMGFSVDDHRNSARNDALRFYNTCRKVLGVPDMNILYIINNKFQPADLLNFVGEDGWLKRNSDSDNFECIIYFSGSGVASNNKDVLGLMNCLNPRFAQIRPDDRNLYYSLDQLRANKIFIISDPSFSGNRSTDVISLAENTGVIIPTGDPTFNNSNICYIASGGVTDYGQPYVEKKHNLFSYLFLDVLLMFEEERQNTIGEIISDVGENMVRYKSYGKPVPKVEIYGNKNLGLFNDTE